MRIIPVFSLTKTESLYVATKFNDEARTKLVKRWLMHGFVERVKQGMYRKIIKEIMC